MLGTTEIIIIGGVVVLLFGATAIPKFAKNLAKAKKEFRDGMAEEREQEEEKENVESSEK